MGRLPIDAHPLAIETRGLSKCYGTTTSLRDCSLEVRSGEVYGLLGKNGAGKTTLIRTLLGFLHPTRGTALICGFDIVRETLKVRQQVSYLPADARLVLAMRGREVLELFAGLHQCGDQALGRQVAERLELDLSRRVMFMSTGMRQKLALVVALGCRPPLTILDEPTANLDPNMRSEVMCLISEIRQRGGTVLLSSHIFSDIDETCDRVGVLRRGELVAVQDLRELQTCHLVHWRGSIDELEHLRRELPAGAELCHDAKTQAANQNSTANVLQFSTPPAKWLAWLSQQPGQVVSIERAGVQMVYDRAEQGRAEQGRAEQGQAGLKSEARS